jgi:hypothetical protein
MVISVLTACGRRLCHNWAMTQKSTRAVTRLDYGQFLVSSQINYTLTYFAGYSGEFSHDAISRHMGRERVTSYILREQARGQIVTSPLGAWCLRPWS